MRGTHAVYASLRLLRSHLVTARAACFHVALVSLVAAATRTWLRTQPEFADDPPVSKT